MTLEYVDGSAQPQVEWLLLRVRGGPLRLNVVALVYRGTDEPGDWIINLDPQRERVFGAKEACARV